MRYTLLPIALAAVVSFVSAVPIVEPAEFAAPVKLAAATPPGNRTRGGRHRHRRPRPSLTGTAAAVSKVSSTTSSVAPYFPSTTVVTTTTTTTTTTEAPVTTTTTTTTTTEAPVTTSEAASSASYEAAPAASPVAAAPALTWTLAKSGNPSADELDAYGRIEAAMTAAVARYGRFSSFAKQINVAYAPGVPTAEASFNGDLRFGSNRGFMNERTALHEISHTLGIGQTSAFSWRCNDNWWPGATALLQSWDGAGARINCGGGHIWPYGLNYDSEWSELNADRHCQLIDAMIKDGMWA
ncbi:hypothetical protein CAC42_7077 [Sphaceloma murrayae]|uniref:Uncharacterized protein n=1 Tax=Sphaceloma murrayae TaxID=2082308 RepID=A0A2K1QQN5_9PEZI|nr:hypothetical protein CAC42_7077 [Sphaceloma murrayae]